MVRGHRTSLRGGGPLTTLVTSQEKNAVLWENIWLNVPRKDDIKQSTQNDKNKIFPWLTHTITSEKHQTVHLDNASPLQMFWGMPRRIRLSFRPAQAEEVCALTGKTDTVMVEQFLMQNYGANYAEGWNHYFSPYYRRKKEELHWLPVHAGAQGVQYTDWPAFTIQGTSNDALTRPAQCVTGLLDNIGRPSPKYTLSIFGYDMDNMKARGWIEASMPIWTIEPDKQEIIREAANTMIAKAQIACRSMIKAVRTALYSAKDVTGDFAAPLRLRFWKETEADFYDGIGTLIEKTKDITDTMEDITEESQKSSIREIQQQWIRRIQTQALEKGFDVAAPFDFTETKKLQQHVNARKTLARVLYSKKFTMKEE